MSHAEVISAYRMFCEEHDLPLFYHPSWLHLAADGKSWGVVTSQNDDGEIICAWPYVESKKLLLKALLNPPLTPYLGPVAPHPMPFNKLDEMANHLPAFAFLEQKVNPELTGTSELKLKEMESFSTPTYLLDLSEDEETIFKNFKSSLRRQIRKGMKNLTIDWGESKYLSSVVSRQLKGRLKRDLPSQVVLEEMMALVNSTDQGTIITARKGEKPLGGLVVLENFNSVIYLIGAQEEEGKKYGTISYLMWEAIKCAKRKGFKTFNFEGSSIPGVARFFESFGSTKSNQYTLRKANHPLVKTYLKYRGK